MADLEPAYIGTASWALRPGQLQDGSSGKTHLERYARHLNAVEINSSFYRPHQRKTYERWAAITSDDFRFSVKVPKAMTHERRFIDCLGLLDQFANDVSGLGKKLSVLLVQTPPSAVFQREEARVFFEALQARTTAQIVIEPRHKSWSEQTADHWLADHRLARAAVDPSVIPGGNQPGGWPHFIYYRLHGSPRVYYSSYDRSSLIVQRQLLRGHLLAGLPTWCIFDNTAAGAALENAVALAGL